MSVTFNGSLKLIICDAGTTSLSAGWLYSRWKEWAQNNPQFLPAFSVIGGDPIGGGLFAGTLFFITNGWRIRPQEATHDLTISGNLFGQNGASVIAPTLGNYVVTVNRVTSSQAQGIATAGGSGLTEAQATMLTELYRIMGLQQGVPLTVSQTQRAAGTITQAISESQGTVTVTRNA